jgi:hypothetical protein
MDNPVEIFFSYAHEDEALMDQVRRQLVIFDRLNIIRKWHDRMISPGSEWKGQIDTGLLQAQIILLFISPDFFESDYCYNIEMKEALSRHNSGQARIIPIILRPCHWQTSPLSHIQVLPTDGKPVTTWDNLDEACLNIATGVMNAISDMGFNRSAQERFDQADSVSLISDTSERDVSRINAEREQKPSIHIGGSVKGQNVVVGGTQSVQGNLTITVGSMPAASQDVREMLQRQIEQLVEALKTVPADQANEAQEVKMTAEDAVGEASKERPDKKRLELRGNNLKKAAESLNSVTPAVFNIASQVAATLMMIG